MHFLKEVIAPGVIRFAAGSQARQDGAEFRRGFPVTLVLSVRVSISRHGYGRDLA